MAFNPSDLHHFSIRFVPINDMTKSSFTTTLCIPQAQDARPVRGHNSQWKYGPLSPYRRAYCSPCGRSTMRPPPANHQSGDDNLKLRQARAKHPATGSPGNCFSAASSEEPDCRTYIGEETKEATGFADRRKHPGEIYLRSLYLLYLSVRSLPLDRICQIILFISA